MCDFGEGEPPPFQVGDKLGMSPGQALYYTPEGLVIGPAARRTLNAWCNDAGYGARATMESPSLQVEVMITNYGSGAAFHAIDVMKALAEWQAVE